jgi:citrate synthase
MNNNIKKVVGQVELISEEISKEIILPLYEDKEKQLFIDISSLNSSGLFTFDPGFLSTASCDSEITYIEGSEGILRYRGYDIEAIAEEGDFMEAAYLLLKGQLPSEKDYQAFCKRINLAHNLPEPIIRIAKDFPKTSHPMAMLSSLVTALSGFYHDSFDINAAKDREEIAIQLIAKVPCLAALIYKHLLGEDYFEASKDLDYISNFLTQLFAKKGEKYQVNSLAKRAVDLLFILHADHEQNASTSTVRLCGSSGADPFAVMGAGVTALWGPAHGGAAEAVVRMLIDLGTSENILPFLEQVKKKDKSARLMGFGHRVYKNYDPRAKIIKKVCMELLEDLNSDDELLKVALNLEKIALQDDYFIQRKLYPNVDFYSGLIYRALAIPVKFFTVMFAIARMVGWVSQWKEMLEDPNQRIGRPRQLYLGENLRPFIARVKR